MPITLPPVSRRRFLAGWMAVSAGLILSRLAIAEPIAAGDPKRIILLSDLHIDAARTAVDRDANMADQLTRVVKQILALDPKPSQVLINGDCAHTIGDVAEYELFAELIKPLREAGLPIHISMGNHDNRDNFWKAIPAADLPNKPVPAQQILHLEFPTADWYMLDSLIKPKTTPGLLGLPQLQWLKKSLDARPDRPAIILTHHQPDLTPQPKGLTDTQALLDILSPRKQVKSLIFGHTHAWNYSKQKDDLHWLNLPPTGYVFTKGKPSGWVDVMMTDKGFSAELICLDEKHPEHHVKHQMDWR